MAVSKFKARFLEHYMAEIFGNETYKSPLLFKNIHQKVKYNLKKLGTSIEKEMKILLEQRKELYNKYSEEVSVEIKTNSDDPNSETKTNVSRNIKEENKDIYLKEDQEILDIEVEISHSDFQEVDFIDQTTGKVVSDEKYFNVMDILIYEKEDENKKEEKKEDKKRENKLHPVE